MNACFPALELPSSLTVNERKVLITILLAEASFFQVNDFQRRRLLFHLYQVYPDLVVLSGEVGSETTAYLNQLLRVPAADGSRVYEGFVELARQSGLWIFLRPIETQLLECVRARSRDGLIEVSEWQEILEQFDVRRLSDIAYYTRRLFEVDRIQVIDVDEQESGFSATLADQMGRDDECMEWFRRLHQPDISHEERQDLRNRIFEHNQRLVPFVLAKLKTSNCRSAVRDRDDDLQTGYTALLTAIERFDVNRGLRFSTYAVQCIRGGILRYRNQYRYLQHVPENQNLFLQRALRLKRELEVDMGRELHFDEWADHLRVPRNRLQPLLEAYRDPLYLGAARSSDSMADEETWQNQLPGSNDVERAVETRELADQLKEALSNLRGREADFLRLRTGIYDSNQAWVQACRRLGRVIGTGEAVPTAEIARAYGVTPSHVRQTVTKAVGKLRGLAETWRLADYL